MGIMSNKITRRVALGSIVVGLGGTAFVLQALRGKYCVDLSQGTNARIVGGKTVVDFYGKKVTVDIPPMEIRTEEDAKRYAKTMREQLRKNPQVNEEIERLLEKGGLQLTSQQKEWVEEEKKRELASIDQHEKEMLDECEKSRWTEREKQELAKNIREMMQIGRTKIVERFSKLQ